LAAAENNAAPRIIHKIRTAHPPRSPSALMIIPTKPRILPMLVMLRPSGSISPLSILAKSFLPQIQAKMPGMAPITQNWRMIGNTRLPMPRPRISMPRWASTFPPDLVFLAGRCSLASSSPSSAGTESRFAESALDFSATKTPSQSEQRTCLPRYSSGTFTFFLQPGHSRIVGMVITLVGRFKLVLLPITLLSFIRFSSSRICQKSVNSGRGLRLSFHRHDLSCWMEISERPLQYGQGRKTLGQ